MESAIEVEYNVGVSLGSRQSNGVSCLRCHMESLLKVGHSEGVSDWSCNGNRVLLLEMSIELESVVGVGGDSFGQYDDLQ